MCSCRCCHNTRYGNSIIQEKVCQLWTIYECKSLNARLSASKCISNRTRKRFEMASVRMVHLLLLFFFFSKQGLCSCRGKSPSVTFKFEGLWSGCLQNLEKWSAYLLVRSYCWKKRVNNCFLRLFHVDFTMFWETTQKLNRVNYRENGGKGSDDSSSSLNYANKYLLLMLGDTVKHCWIELTCSWSIFSCWNFNSEIVYGHSFLIKCL